MGRFLTRPMAATEEERWAKEDILDLIHFERFCRDNALWDEMRRCYSEDSFVDISWYQGSGDGFVTASSKMRGFAPHRVHSAMTWVNGERAVTVMTVTLQMRREFDGVLCELSSDTQLLFCTKRIVGQWFICRFESIYEQDRLIPVLPNQTLNIDSAMLSKYRQSYACMSYFAEKNGIPTNQELAGLDHPETVRETYGRLDAWLEGNEI